MTTATKNEHEVHSQGSEHPRLGPSKAAKQVFADYSFFKEQGLSDQIIQSLVRTPTYWSREFIRSQ